jgi:hypothetical protein
MSISKVRRKTYFYVITIFSILNVGCIHSRHVLNDSLTEELDQINKELEEKRAQIALLSDSKELAAENMYLSADSVYYVETKTDGQERIAIADVHRIITKNHGRGAVEGFAGGLITWGGLVGISILAAGGAEAEDGPTGGTLVYYTILAGAPLPIVGTIIGAAVGSKKIYVFK